MAKYEILIANKNTSESHRKNKGDILAVRPHPWNWGKTEIEIGLVVIVESSKKLEEMRLLSAPIFQKDGVKKFSHEIPEGEESQWALVKKGGNNVDMTVLGTVITDLDNTKLEDDSMIYQPMKARTQLVSKFDGGIIFEKGDEGKTEKELLDEGKEVKKRHLVTTSDVDTNSVVADSDTELSIDLAVTLNLIKNQITDSAQVFSVGKL